MRRYDNYFGGVTVVDISPRKIRNYLKGFDLHKRKCLLRKFWGNHYEEEISPNDIKSLDRLSKILFKNIDDDIELMHIISDSLHPGCFAYDKFIEDVTKIKEGTHACH